MRTIICGALMALTIMPVPAAENATSAGYMMPHCKASLDYPPGTFIQGFCAGVVVGVAAMAQPLFAPRQARAAERCVNIPESITNRQFVQVVVRYIEAHLNRMDEQFRVLAVEALFDAWPCKK